MRREKWWYSHSELILMIFQLHIAAANGFYDVAAFLLRNRLDPNTRDNDLWTSGILFFIMSITVSEIWCTPYPFECYGEVIIISLSTFLHSFFCSVHAAAAWAQPDLLELLCDYGGEINAKTSNMEAPIGMFINLIIPLLFTSNQYNDHGLFNSI